jgi:tetratricopeptide (TPR) repeat protein
MLRQFPAALKLYDRALDIMPNNPEAMAEKAVVYQAQGNLQEAARLLAEINAQTPNDEAVGIKITQLRLERNYAEAVRLLKTRLAQFHYASEREKTDNQLRLALIERLAGDSADAKSTAEEARNMLEPWYKNQPNNPSVALRLAWAHAVLGEKELALKEAESVIMLYPRAERPVDGPGFEESPAFIQAMFGENNPAISTLRQLLQTPYLGGSYYPAPITVALLRLDPFWDPLRAEPAFQELCEEKQP